ncbi:hypothetical protein PsYK624_061000 [Phanerochaete sordida]|uniref:Uncharacterized protein n=1 Tax=Phanerochaete sordida TaxID=48140 RepID=A0A9P3LBZ3_9APHY|nr:hypothetical protein PsYK624_061000 [Phanerochaete sordida]
MTSSPAQCFVCASERIASYETRVVMICIATEANTAGLAQFTVTFHASRIRSFCTGTMHAPAPSRALVVLWDGRVATMPPCHMATKLRVCRLVHAHLLWNWSRGRRSSSSRASPALQIPAHRVSAAAVLRLAIANPAPARRPARAPVASERFSFWTTIRCAVRPLRQQRTPHSGGLGCSRASLPRDAVRRGAARRSKRDASPGMHVMRLRCEPSSTIFCLRTRRCRIEGALQPCANASPTHGGHATARCAGSARPQRFRPLPRENVAPAARHRREQRRLLSRGCAPRSADPSEAHCRARRGRLWRVRWLRAIWP